MNEEHYIKVSKVLELLHGTIPVHTYQKIKDSIHKHKEDKPKTQNKD